VTRFSLNEDKRRAGKAAIFWLSYGLMIDVGIRRRRARLDVRAIAEVLGWSCLVIALAYVGYLLHVTLYIASLVFLLAAVFATIASGAWAGCFISLVAALCLDYFYIPPILHFDVADANGWMALATFEVCALVISRLSSRERERRLEVETHRKQMERLYDLSRATASLDMRQPLGPQLAYLILRSFDFEDVSVFDAINGRMDHAGNWSGEESEAARTAYLLDKNDDNGDARTSTRVLRIGSSLVGALTLHGDVSDMLADALASLVAMTFERARSLEKETRAESAHQSEKLRGAVLDALAHAFKTPLTVIRIASAGLLEAGDLPPDRVELASLIDGESMRLSQLCDRLLQTAKLEAEKVKLKWEDIDIQKLVEEVKEELSESLKGHPLEVSAPSGLALVSGDRELLATVLGQYLDNAAKYSNPETPIGISVRDSATELVVAVHSLGPVIPIGDRERVFERFYRCPQAMTRALGTGVGLSIVKKAAEAHHGHVWVISAESEGTTFFLSLPKIRYGEGKHEPWNDFDRR
jgi:two-component system sensor histidine kinase KdpD